MLHDGTRTRSSSVRFVEPFAFFSLLFSCKEKTFRKRCQWFFTLHSSPDSLSVERENESRTNLCVFQDGFLLVSKSFVLEKKKEKKRRRIVYIRIYIYTYTHSNIRQKSKSIIIKTQTFNLLPKCICSESHLRRNLNRSGGR